MYYWIIGPALLVGTMWGGMFLAMWGAAVVCDKLGVKL